MAAGGGVPQLGGHNYEFVDEVPDKLKCAICLLPLKNPMQVTKCGHRFCKLCIDPILSNPPACCPGDRQPISADKVFEDAACEREVLELHVKCPSEGCGWSGELRDVENHEGICPYKLLKCENEGCKEEIMRFDLPLHVTTTCQWREVTCVHCDKKLISKFAQEHNAECECYPLPCVNNCGRSDIPRDQMTAHVTTVCPTAVIPCKYEHMGCQVKIRRDTMQDHVKESMEEHLDLACAKLKQLEDRAEEREESTDKSRLDLMCAKLEQLEESVKRLACEQPLHTRAKSAGLLKAPAPSHYVPFVWKIGCFENHLQKAKLGFPEIMLSDPFYTAPQGYKMRLKCFPNGNKDTKGSHLFVYIIIMKGEYDNILTWPFHQKVRFTLIDQHEEEKNRNNLSLFFTPDPTWKSFKKPNSRENEGRGFRKFVSHEVLQTRRYIVDDTILLKVEIG